MPESKFRSGTYAQILNLASTLGIQVVQVPIFLGVVGVETYGSYLGIVAIPAGLILADFGVLAASSTHMLGLISRGEVAEARRVSQFANTFILIMCSVILAVIAAAMALGYPSAVPGISATSAKWIFGLYSLYAVLNLGTTSVEGVMRAANEYPRAWTLISVFRLSDFAAAMITLVISRDLVLALVAMVVARLLAVWGIYSASRKFAPWATRVPSFRSLAIARQLMRPMVGSFLQPVSNLVLSQGSVIVINVVLGPAAVVGYSTVRTMVNAIRQAVMVFVNAGLPSVTHSLSLGDHHGAYRTLRKIGTIAGVLLGTATVFLLLFGHWILELWTGHRVEFPSLLLPIFLTASVIECAWLVLSVWIVAMNLQFTMSIVYVGAVALYLGALILWLPQSSVALAPFLQALAMLVVLAYVAFAVIRDSRRKMMR